MYICISESTKFLSALSHDMCKMFSWMTSTVSGTGQKVLLDFLGMLVSLNVFLANALMANVW